MSDAAVADPVAPDAPPFDANALVQELRVWITNECSLGESVRDDSYRCAMSAIVHRVMKWGWEPTLNLLTARDCMNCILMAGGEGAEFFMRLAFTRGLVEDDRAVVQRLIDTPFIPECRAFVSQIMHSLSGGEEAMREGAVWMETLQGEELSIACLIIGRQVPAVLCIEWLMQCPAENPRLCAEMALLLLRGEGYEAAVKAYVRERPKVRYAIDSERWPQGL